MLARFGCALCLLLPATGLSQTPQAAPSSPAPAATPSASTQPAPTAQIRTGTQLVIVDVVVQDAAGHPVHNLPREAFQVTENKTPQAVTSFEEHSAANPAKPGPVLPKMPPGNFTNYTPVPPGGALNVLLVDALNTPMQDQAYLRDQLKAYVNKAQPGSRVAIFGLNTRLYLLQGFTSDLEVLKEAVNHSLVPRGSHLMDDAVSNSAESPISEQADQMADMGLTEVAADLQQFEAVVQSQQMQLRIQYTLDAFEDIAHYLAAFPGRKNLIWFSGSFPINILPDPTIKDPFAVMQTNGDEFREITSLLSRSQVAVYPIDARGLMNPPMMNASNSGSQYVKNPTRMNNDLAKFFQSQADEHSTMDEMAFDTGGKAYYNTNGLTDAIASALDTGANYYTVAYRPEYRDPHGEYRSIHVDLTGPQAAGLKLFYRRGYFADDPHKAPSMQAAAASTPASGKTASGTPPPPVDPAAVYSRAAMFHGAPLPEDILFKARILPVSTNIETTLTPRDVPNPTDGFKGPYRRFNIDIAVMGNNFRLTKQPDGKYKGAAEFKTFVYNPDGKLLNLAAETVNFNLPFEEAKKMVSSGVTMHLEVSAPAKGESYLRVGIRDVPTNHYGVVEVPTAVVARLPPLPPQPDNAPAPDSVPAAAPASTPPTSTPSPATPTTPH